LTTLHAFNDAEGYRPGGLVLGSDGNFYGTTTTGAPNGRGGSIYRITPRGALTVLYNFSDTSGNPSATLLQATDGKLYGVTSLSGGGTVFSFSLGLRPFVRALPHSGTPGALITILGTDLAGASKVTFNGNRAEFTVISPTRIQTTVPAGAISGWIEVVTGSGPILSSGPFVVR
jgi:uncharacterized repeat protein (TIGR03803 family)